MYTYAYAYTHTHTHTHTHTQRVWPRTQGVWQPTHTLELVPWGGGKRAAARSDTSSQT
jgi:hypothetical protein